MAELPPYPGRPRWVKASGVIAGLLVLLFVVLLHGGLIGRGDSGYRGLHGETAPSGAVHTDGQR